ncbi:MAG: alcohol dehydrogenase [Candidatus Muproteobacteria bacterium RBG_16_64_10]|uniref:Alcohol dehydrogenase n=1 Tax=Candidatus Muproteobacteria bacterium RBG_16_64_10 TaxID=1817757 RepID=A0A1F6T6J3_9PROT|nr:MAG: alcohol dehydrogenase [Candidatus Muproteobacteria bacterium RBG_16_64_10]
MFPAGGFFVSRLPRIVFGFGKLKELPDIVAGYGRHGLLVTGSKSLRASKNWPLITDGLRAAGVVFESMAVEGEPAPSLVDNAVAEFRQKGIDVVVGIGGGSALDAAKAIAGLLQPGNSVLDHLEGIGRDIPYKGPATPYIAVPTTAGTGSEATKNAVLSMPGENGYKKSFRDDKLVAQVALVDPELLATCPLEVIAANGMDAFTQMLESYVSINASQFTDALAWSGMEAVRDSFFAAYAGGESEAARRGRAGMAYGALLSGITLAQAGLGSVHGLASPLGAFFPIPHGVACGTLVAIATEANIRVLRSRLPDSPALLKYARVGELLAAKEFSRPEIAWQALMETLHGWTDRLQMRRLGAYGIGAAQIPKIVVGSRGSSMKTNPVVLTDEEIAEIVRARL